MQHNESVDEAIFNLCQEVPEARPTVDPFASDESIVRASRKDECISTHVTHPQVTQCLGTGSGAINLPVGHAGNENRHLFSTGGQQLLGVVGPIGNTPVFPSDPHVSPVGSIAHPSIVAHESSSFNIDVVGANASPTKDESEVAAAKDKSLKKEEEEVAQGSDDSSISQDSSQQRAAKPGIRKIKKSAWWSKEEHEKFIAGLQKFNLMDGLGPDGAELMSMYLGGHRTVLQVRSHAQKYFQRQRRGKSSD